MAIWTNMLQLQEADAAGGGRSLRAGSLLCSKPTPLGMTHFLFLLMLQAQGKALI